MFSVYRTLSLRYLQRRWLRALLMVASIALGVATMVATHALNQTMARAALASSNPLAGVADFIVTRGELTLPRSLAQELADVPGVKSAQARIFSKAFLPDLKKDVLVVGLDFLAIFKDLQSRDQDLFKISQDTINKYISIQGSQVFLPAALRQIPVIVGKTLDDEIPARTIFLRVQKDTRARIHKLVYTGPVEALDKFAMLSGYTLVLDLANAAEILDMKLDQANRVDVIIDPTANRDEVQRALTQKLANRASISTPEESMQAQQSAMSGMQTGFSLCGIAALVVGIFLVYNTLSVSVAERRHEIGLLLALGATRAQVLKLFAGEAALLGLCGSAVGLPLGYALALLGLQPMQDVVGDIFGQLHMPTLEMSPGLLAVAGMIGVLNAVVASLKPAIEAALENPSEAVRRVPKAATLRHLVLQISTSALLVVAGTVVILVREHLPNRIGTYGGLMMVLVGALFASPFFAALIARLFLPLARSFLSIEWRLAADNLVRSPGRTGLVIGALAAGVSLVVQTTGTIRSNRIALRDWVQDSFTADLVLTAGGPVSASQTLDMDDALGAELCRQLPILDAALPTRLVKVPFRDTQIFLVALEADQLAHRELQRQGRTSNNELIRRLHEEYDCAIVSENFAALHHVRKGDTITLAGDEGPVPLKVVGEIVDYTWNHGSIILNRRDFRKHWHDDKVTVYDLFLQKGADPRAAKDQINKRFGAQYQLVALTREELQTHIDDMIERLYSVAYGQQIVVMLVAAMGVVTALLISVLQRRRELGMLRAIGASRGQVIYSVLAEACLMGVIGTFIGLLVGIPLQWYILQVVILEESGYLFPLYIPWSGGVIIGIAAMITATLAGLGPALHAVRQRIPEAIAYE